MIYRRAAALFLLLAAAPASAESLSDLAARVRTFLTGKTVAHARPVTAVAAVRGSAPMDQDENLDLLVLNAVAAQRAAAEPDRKALKGLYEAISASYAVQAYAASKDPELRAAAAAELSAWSKRVSGAPKALASAFAKPDASFDENALVKAGWAAYVRSLVPKPAPAAAPAAPSFDSETAGLDEQLKGLRDAWLSKDLDDAAKGRAYLLAAQVSNALGSAPFKVEKAASAGAVAVAAELAAAPDEPAVEFVPRKIYDGAAKSVVVIIASDPGGAGELGTGSVIAPGKVLTNAHVVVRESTKAPWPSVRVYFKPAKMTGDPKTDLAKPAAAKVVSFDRALDLALLSVEDAPDVPPIPLADPPTVSVGDRVAAIGHPEQGGLWTLTTGVLSSLVADIGGVKGKHVFQTDASINRGNSGGPLLDSRGRIVGVNTLMSRKAADGLAITSVNFAVRSDVARAWLKTAGATPAAAAVASAPSPAPAPQPVMVASTPAPVRSAPTAVKAPKKVTITESKPYSREDLIQRAIADLEDQEAEMHEEIIRKRK